MNNQVFEDNVKLIYKIANQFYGVEKDDLLQAGKLGLVKAYKNYQYNEDTKFSTFAYKYIFGEMYALTNKKELSVNRDILKMYKLIEKTRYELAQKVGYVPSNKEIAKYLEMSQESVEYACTAGFTIISLDNTQNDERSFYETIAKDENISQDDKIMLYDSLDKIPEEERKAIIASYLQDKTQDKIAKELNTSQVRVSRLIDRGLDKMRLLMKTA